MLKREARHADDAMRYRSWRVLGFKYVDVGKSLHLLMGHLQERLQFSDCFLLPAMYAYTHHILAGAWKQHLLMSHLQSTVVSTIGGARTQFGVTVEGMEPSFLLPVGLLVLDFLVTPHHFHAWKRIVLRMKSGEYLFLVTVSQPTALTNYIPRPHVPHRWYDHIPTDCSKLCIKISGIFYL
jgi:hypothetical protein